MYWMFKTLRKDVQNFWGYLSVLFSSFVFVLELKNRYAQETKCLLNKINDYSSKSMLYKKKKENHVNIIYMSFFFFFGKLLYMSCEFQLTQLVNFFIVE